LNNYPFNVRVYGLLVNEHNELLISDEQEYGKRFTKFPGGALEFGEGLLDGLKREFMEECSMAIDIVKHFYTTDFFLTSMFDGSQLVCMYYIVKNVSPIALNIKNTPFDFDGEGDVLQAFRWIRMDKLKKSDFTFPLDQHVAVLLLTAYELS
jgi:8-oxo-dGTP diphosphatase